jgi:hypothetical protein
MDIAQRKEKSGSCPDPIECFCADRFDHHKVILCCQNSSKPSKNTLSLHLLIVIRYYLT